MKKIIFLLSLMLLLGSCKNELTQPPKKLIEQDKMVAIIYDLALLEAMRSQPQNMDGQKTTMINPKIYIFKKYKIDSLQFAESNHYYASDVDNYKKMYDQVRVRLEAQQKQAEIVVSKTRGKKTISPSDTIADKPQIK